MSANRKSEFFNIKEQSNETPSALKIYPSNTRNVIKERLIKTKEMRQSTLRKHIGQIGILLSDGWRKIEKKKTFRHMLHEII